jgi:hypothetical protein
MDHRDHLADGLRGGAGVGRVTLRQPFIGDVLLDPQRTVIWVDREARRFKTEPLHGTPDWHFGAENLPEKMRGRGFAAAPIEPGWTEILETP